LDKRTFEEASEAWRTYRKTEMDYLMGGRDLVFNDSSPLGSPLASPELDEGPAAVDLSLYVHPPFQLADDDFEELLRRTRESITERED